MSAADHLHAEQLKMFMSPREIEAAGYKPNPKEIAADVEGEVAGGINAMMSRKLYEAKEPDLDYSTGEVVRPSLYDRIAQEGVRNPVHLAEHSLDRVTPREQRFGMVAAKDGGRVIGNGHHRFAAQREQDPDKLLPVMHHEHRAQAILWEYEERNPPRRPGVSW